jgi:hypothetical protein
MKGSKRKELPSKTTILPRLPRSTRIASPDDGRSMARDFLRIDQGVCITSHASECRTVRQIVGLVPLSAMDALDEKAFYVMVSRATHKAIMYTDCKDALRESVLRCGDRPSVWEYQKPVDNIIPFPLPKRDKALEQKARALLELFPSRDTRRSTGETNLRSREGLQGISRTCQKQETVRLRRPCLGQ